jgi:hypothetical protein
MKTFKEYITEIKFQKAQRIAKAASKKQAEYDSSFNAFHNIMGSGAEEKLLGVMSGSNHSRGGEELYRKADQGVLRQIYKGGAKPENATQHAKNVLGIVYPTGGVRAATMGKKMSAIKTQMKRAGKGERGHPFNSSLYPDI